MVIFHSCVSLPEGTLIFNELGGISPNKFTHEPSTIIHQIYPHIFHILKPQKDMLTVAFSHAITFMAHMEAGINPAWRLPGHDLWQF